MVPYWAFMSELGAGKTKSRDRFVDGAVGLGSRVVLEHALAAEEKAGGAVVTATGRHSRFALPLLAHGLPSI